MPSFLFLLLYSWFCSSWAIAVTFSAQFSSSFTQVSNKSQSLKRNQVYCCNLLWANQHYSAAQNVNDFEQFSGPLYNWVALNRIESCKVVIVRRSTVRHRSTLVSETWVKREQSSVIVFRRLHSYSVPDATGRSVLGRNISW